MPLGLQKVNVMIKLERAVDLLAGNPKRLSRR